MNQVQRRWVTLGAGLLLAALGLLSAAEPAGIQKKPVPDATAQGKAEAVIRTLYKAKFTKALDNVAARHELAVTLLEEGKRTNDDDALRFVAFREARDLAARAADLTLALQAAQLLGEDFAVDLPGMKLDLLKVAAATVAGKEEQRALVRRLLTVVTEAVERDQYDAARGAGKLAVELAGRVGQASLSADVAEHTKALEQQQAAFEKVQPALKKLDKNPNDADAHVVVGKYLCFVKGRWTEGLPHLAKGSDAALRTLADQDAKAVAGGPAVPEEVARAAGEGWWERIAKEGPGAAAQLKQRAFRWYKAALPKLAGLTKVRIQSRVDEVQEEFPYLAAGYLRTLQGHQAEILSVAITPDGKLALSASWDKSVRVWNIVRGKEVGRFLGHQDQVNCVAVSPDGKYAASAGVEMSIQVWEVESRVLVHTLVGHAATVRTVAFSPDGKQLISGGNDNSLRLWDVQNGQLLHTIADAHAGSTEAAIFSADGRYLLSGGWDHKVTLWDAGTRKAIRTMTGHTKGVYRVALTADARLAVSCSADKSVRVWDVESGKEVQRLEGHTDDVIGMALAADGRRLLSGGGANDKTMRLWDLETGKTLDTYEGHTNGVWCIAFAPNGWRAVSGGPDRTLRVWAIPK